MSRPYLSQPTDVSIPGISRYQADYEEHATFTQNIELNNHKITSLSDGTNDKDAVNKKKLDTWSLLVNLPRIKIIKRVKTGRFQNSLRSQLLFSDTFHYGKVLDCYLEIFTNNVLSSKWINIRAQSMERYNCEIKIKRTYSTIPIDTIPSGMLSYMFYLEIGHDFKITHGIYNGEYRQYHVSYLCLVD